MRSQSKGRISWGALAAIAAITFLCSVPQIRANEAKVQLGIVRVLQISEDIDGNSPGDFFARVSIDGVDLPKTYSTDNDEDVTLFDWIFDRSTASPVVAITIEIWDDDGGDSRPDQCDVNPASGIKRLNLIYRIVTGTIEGDVTGKQGDRIDVRGEGDSNQVQISFFVRHVPSFAPTVTLTIERVREISKKIDNGDSPADFYARVTIERFVLPKTNSISDTADVSPNWTFQDSTVFPEDVALIIEIWDDDGGVSSPDLCDVNPASGFKTLLLGYNLTTGTIKGDVTGKQGDLLSVRGAGDGDEVEIWFRVTSGKVASLPEVLASELYVKLLWDTSTADADLRTIETTLCLFNNRLYDVTDGQWRIGRFVIHDDRSELDEEESGVVHVHKGESHREQAPRVGSPIKPSFFHVNFDSSSGTWAHEFLHAYGGLRDEYYTLDINNPDTHCPASSALQFATDACIMDRNASSELCRPTTHNPNTSQGLHTGLDCYSHLARVMNIAGFPLFQVSSVHIPGPTSAPPLHFVYLTITKVHQIDKFIDSNSPGDFYARVSMDGLPFAPSEHFDNVFDDLFPNWIFGLAYSSNEERSSIPLTIEILDDDGGSSDDDLCDINPVPGKQTLFLVYNPTTGNITGDVTGVRDTPITATGSGDIDRVAVSFVVTSRKYSATAVTLTSFTAATVDDNGCVMIQWETATEVDNAGFNLYRSRRKNGTYTRINNTSINAKGDAVSGASYSYVDTPGRDGTYYYKLEDVDYYGVSTMPGTEKVRVRSGNNGGT